MQRKAIFYGFIFGAGVLAGLIFNQFLTHSLPSPLQADKPDYDSLLQEIHSLPDPSRIYELVSRYVSPSVVNLRIKVDKYDHDPFFGFVYPSHQLSLGSGVIVDKKGHVITNYHVIQSLYPKSSGESGDIEAILSNQQVFPATILGADPVSDVAVLQLKGIDPGTVKPALLGNSDQLETGQGILLLGDPLGLASSVSAGIVSSLDRTGINFPENPSFHENLIQIDAAVNKGYSGGAMVNLQGEVMGMIVGAIMSPQVQYSSGIGFVIPINIVHSVMKDIIERGQVQRGFLGIQMMNVNGMLGQYIMQTYGLVFHSFREMLSYLGLKDSSGVFVYTVQKGSPADKAGLQEGDVITALDGRKVADAEDLSQQVSQHRPGDIVSLTLLRERQEKRLTVTLGERPK